MSFSDAVEPSTVSSNTVFLRYPTSGDLVPARRLWVEGNRVRTFPMLSDAGRIVEAVVKGGPSGVRGRAGGMLARDVVWTFSTEPKLDVKIIPVQVVDGAALIKGREGLVRVKAEWGRGAGEGSDVKQVTADVELTYNGTRTFTRRGVRFEETDTFQRQGNSANFYSRDGQMPILDTPGAHTLQATVRAAGGATTFTNALQATVLPDWRGRNGDATWRVLFVPIVFGGNSVVETFQPNAPASVLHQETAAKAMAHARALFPLDRVEHRVSPVCRIVEPPSSLGALSAWTVDRMLYGIRAASRQYDVVVGLVPNLWLSATVGASGLTDQGTPVCLVADDIVQTADRGGWRQVENPCIFTHEIGHCYAIDHPAGPRHAPIYGYDLASDQAIQHATGPLHRPYDIMYVDIDGEAPPDVWIDRVSYTNFMRTLYGRGGVSLDGIPLHRTALGRHLIPQDGGSSAGAWLLRGRIAGGPGAYTVTQASVRALADVPPPLDAGAGSFTAELRGAGDVVLAGKAFAPVGAANGGGATQGAYAVELPWDNGVRSVAIRAGGATIWSRARSAHAPTVALTAPAPGTILTGTVPAAWSGADADGDPLVFAIDFSPEGGAAWWPLASGMTNAVADLDSRLIENTTNAWLRISAWDGFDVAVAVHGPYTVSNPAAVLFTAPAGGVSNAPATAAVEIGFRDAMAPGSFTGGAIAIRRAGEAHPWPGAVAYDAEARIARWTPAQPLPYETAFTGVVAAAVCDARGHALGADHVWTFRTGPDRTPPEVAAMIPLKRCASSSRKRCRPAPCRRRRWP